MFFVLLFLFTVVPLVELTLLVKLGQSLGLIPTIVLVIGTGMLGAALARWQGLRAATRVQQQLAQHIVPTSEVFEGLLILAAGLLLITPGVVSDVAGLTLLIPPCRTLVRRSLAHWLLSRIQIENVSVASRERSDARPRDGVIDAEAIDARVYEGD